MKCMLCMLISISTDVIRPREIRQGMSKHAMCLTLYLEVVEQVRKFTQNNSLVPIHQLERE